ncbi:hypothetical protein [Streptomyces sp. cg35]|uniref:hypothetical protein n=1 Tax=Streptomyces sp. cg35 TaxID=3421650 RepID=UPI003D185EC8
MLRFALAQLTAACAMDYRIFRDTLSGDLGIPAAGLDERAPRVHDVTLDGISRPSAPPS